MELTPGAVVADRYRVERKVGEGGMGEVWAGEHVAIGVRVALKTLLSTATNDRSVIARFKREAMLLGRLRSDHVARVVDFVTDEKFGLVLVMDFVEGESLAGSSRSGGSRWRRRSTSASTWCARSAICTARASSTAI